MQSIIHLLSQSVNIVGTMLVWNNLSVYHPVKFSSLPWSSKYTYIVYLKCDSLRCYCQFWDLLQHILVSPHLRLMASAPNWPSLKMAASDSDPRSRETKTLPRKPDYLVNTEGDPCTLDASTRALFKRWTSLQMHSLFWEWNPIRGSHRRGHIHRGTNYSWGLGLERGGTTQCFISGSMFRLPSRLYFR